MKLLFRPKENNNNKIRYDIQFLRAVAVLAVVIYHLFPTKLVGGFMGVDVFFVISGYLMTKTLIKDFNQGYLDQKFASNLVSSPKKNSFLESIKILARFYARRIKRLAPAASFCLIIVLAISLFSGFWVSILELSKQVFASSTFWQNIYLYLQGVDYIGQNTPDSAVQHFWSLSLEEQFYMIWPILLLISILLGAIIFRKKINITQTQTTLTKFDGVETTFNRIWIIPAIIIIIFTFVFFGAGYYLTKIGDVVGSYFLTPARIWELSLGGIICFLPTIDQDLPFRIKDNFLNPIAKSFTSNLKLLILLIIPWVGLFFTAWALIRFNGNDFPGWKALVPTLGTVLIIYGGSFYQKNFLANVSDQNLTADISQKTSKFQKLYETLSLNNFARFRPFQFIGDASYSIYLYYCPVIILVPLFLEIDLWQGHRLLRISLFFANLILGALSYYLIEQPTRKYKFSKKPTLKIILSGIFLMATVIVFSLGVQNFAQTKVDIALSDLASIEESAELEPDFESSCFGAISILNKDKCQDVLWTSNKELEAYAPEDRDKAIQLGNTDLDDLDKWSFGDLNSSKTILLWGDSKAAQYSDGLIFASQKLGYKIIIAYQSQGCAPHWNSQIDGSYAGVDDVKEKCITANQRIYNELVPKVDYIFLISARWRRMINQDVQFQKLANLLDYIDGYQIPTYIVSDIPFLPKEPGIEICYANPSSCETNYREKWVETDQKFNSELETYTDNFSFINTLDNFCDDEICHLGNGGLPIYRDFYHINGTYSESMGPWFVRELEKLGL